MANRIVFFLTLFVLLGNQVDAQTERLDETWTVTVGGQTVFPNPDGSFRVPNLISVDADSDGLGDDLLRVIAVGTSPGGQAKYAYSGRFRLSQGQTFDIDVLTFSNELPAEIVRSVQIEGPDEVSVGDIETLTVTAILEDGQEFPIQTEAAGTTYRSSNPSILSVSNGGVVEALEPGNAAILAMNSGASGIKSFRVLGTQTNTTIQGFVQLPDGSSAMNAAVELTDGSSTMTNLDGRFAHPVTALRVLVNIQAIASYNDGQSDFVGRSSSHPVSQGGTTDVGIIVLEPKEPPPLLAHSSVHLFRSHADGEIYNIKVADMNSDNISDVVIGTNERLSILTFDNGGRLTESLICCGGFTESILAGSGNEYDFAVSDFDLDGDLDLVSASRNYVGYYENLGDGTWQPDSSLIVGLDLPQNYQFVRSEDLDGDGYQELIFATQGSLESLVGVVRNNGNKEFIDPIVYSLPGNFEPMDTFKIIDIDRDQDFDVVAFWGFAFDSHLRIGFNDGGANLTWTDQIPLSGPDQVYPNVFFEDTNHDGHVDLIGSGQSGNDQPTLVTFLNAGDNTTFTHVPTPFEFSALASADINRDGTPDTFGVKFWNWPQNTHLFEPTAAFGDGQGAFQNQIDFGLSYYSSGGESADINGDGFTDIILWQRWRLGVFENDTNGGVRTEAVVSTGIVADEMVAIEIDGNNGDDIAILSNSPRSVRIASSNGDGTINIGPSVGLGGTQLHNLHAIELTGDAHVDLVCLKEGSGSESIVFLENDGTGGLLAPQELPIDNLLFPFGLSIGNLDQDLADELVVVERDVLHIFKQIDGFNYQETEIAISGISGPRPLLGDVDGDGDTDLVVRSGGGLAVLLQTSPLVFEDSGELLEESLLSPSYEIAFIDSDDFPDLVVVRQQSGEVVIYYGSPSGFVMGEEFNAYPAFGANSLRIVDLDLDGALDILVASGDGQGRTGIAAITHNPDGSGLSMRHYGGTFPFSPSTAWDIVAVDLDLDGDPEVVQSDGESRLFLIHENRLR